MIEMKTFEVKTMSFLRLNGLGGFFRVLSLAATLTVFGMVGCGNGAGCNGFGVGVGDADGDGVGSATDNCPDDANADQADTDGDEIGDVCDNSPNDPNPGQGDADLPAGKPGRVEQKGAGTLVTAPGTG